MRHISLVERAHKFISEILKGGDIAIDATVGNGYDTLFLANIVGPHGKIYGFDIQPEAIENTRKRICESGMESQVQLALTGHQNLLDLIPPHVRNRITAVMFNLGYLPNSDNKIKTTTSTTLAALEAAIDILAASGRMTIIAYTGHSGGRKEAEAVKAWAESLSCAIYRTSIETPVTVGEKVPVLIAIEKYRRRSLV